MPLSPIYLRPNSSVLNSNLQLYDIVIDPTRLAAEYEVAWEGNANSGFVGYWGDDKFDKWNMYVKQGVVRANYPGLDFDIVKAPVWPKRIRIRQAPDGCTVNGVFVPHTATSISSRTHIRVHGRTTDNPGDKRYYWIKLFMDGQLIRDLIPKVVNNVAGLYCTYTDKWYPGPSALSFSVGSEA